jgi:tetratricopeptide (TPR) repeat protein
VGAARAIVGVMAALSDLLLRYELTGDEDAFVAAQRGFEEAVVARGNGRLLLDYGYLMQCHGSYSTRRAITLYEQAIAADPGLDKPRYQLISAKAAVSEPHDAVAEYRARVAAEPGEVRWYRLLACAHLAVRAFASAVDVVNAGLALAPDDPRLVEFRGDARAGGGDVDGALADWRRALDLDSDTISALYSSALLLEREGRTREAANAWRSIIAWSEARCYTEDTEWPRRELARLGAHP